MINYWSESEIDYLKKMCGKLTHKEIAEVLNRTTNSVAHMVSKIINGKSEHKRKRTREHYTGCDFDCFHCPYSDCLAPSDKNWYDIDLKDFL